MNKNTSRSTFYTKSIVYLFYALGTIFVPLSGHSQTPGSRFENSGPLSQVPQAWLRTREPLSPVCSARLSELAMNPLERNLPSNLSGRGGYRRLNPDVERQINDLVDQSRVRSANRNLVVQPRAENQYEYSRFFDQPGEVGFLFLHGLFGSSNQFERYFSMALRTRSNFISTNYAGNGPRSQEGPLVTHQVWKKEVRAAMDRLLQAGSKKIVIMGQSTGGALALEIAGDPQYASKVGGLILFEPAIRVIPHLRLAACTLRQTSGQSLGALARLAGIDIHGSHTYWLGLGCEVERILDTVVENGRTLTFESVLERVNAPTLAIEAANDRIVSNDAIRRFVHADPQRRSYLQTPGRHSQSETQNGLLEPSHLVEFILDRFNLGSDFRQRLEAYKFRRNELADEDLEILQKIRFSLGLVLDGLEEFESSSSVTSRPEENFLELKGSIQRLLGARECFSELSGLPNLQRLHLKMSQISSDEFIRFLGARDRTNPLPLSRAQQELQEILQRSLNEVRTRTHQLQAVLRMKEDRVFVGE